MTRSRFNGDLAALEPSGQRPVGAPEDSGYLVLIVAGREKRPYLYGPRVKLGAPAAPNRAPHRPPGPGRRGKGPRDLLGEPGVVKPQPVSIVYDYHPAPVHAGKDRGGPPGAPIQMGHVGKQQRIAAMQPRVKVHKGLRAGNPYDLVGEVGLGDVEATLLAVGHERVKLPVEVNRVGVLNVGVHLRIPDRCEFEHLGERRR
jgi:hypothetical protein